MKLKHAVAGVVIALVSLCHHLHPAHAVLVDPASRGTLWKRGYHVPAKLEENALYCGGHQHQELTEYGANFGRGEVTKIFNAGGPAIFEVDQSNINKDNAYIEFKICPSNDSLEHEPQDCFDRHPILLADGTGYRFQLAKNRKAQVQVKLPKNLNCNFCVLQYHIHEGNAVAHLDSLHKRQRGSQGDYYGCSDIAVLHDYDSNFQAQGNAGPLIDGVIIKGAANFGNIFGPGSISSGTANAWSQNIQSSGQYSQSSHNGGGVRGPLIKGILIEGPGNFGNIYGAKSVSTGTANAWSQSVVNSQGGSSKGSQTAYHGLGQVISGPGIKGISINGPSNFGNIFGRGSISSGNANAWSQHVTYGTFQKGHGNGSNDGSERGPGDGVVIDIKDFDAFINFSCDDTSTTSTTSTTTTQTTTTTTTTTTTATTTPPTTTLTTPPATTQIIPDIPINCNETLILPPPSTTTYPPGPADSTATPSTVGTTRRPGSDDRRPPFIIGPSIHGISINGSANFGNIFGHGSISTGNANAWSQKFVNSGPYLNNYGANGPSLAGIRINGAGNFGNIFGKGSVSTGNANAWSQHVSNGAKYASNGQGQGSSNQVGGVGIINQAQTSRQIYGSGSLNSVGSSLLTQSVLHTLQSRPIGSAISSVRYWGAAKPWADQINSGGAFSVSR